MMREIVIKLPEKVINRILEYKEMPYTDLVIEAIYHGIFIPKGHGKLKDVNSIVAEIDRAYPNLDRQDIKQWVFNADTIIEADNAVSEDKE